MVYAIAMFRITDRAVFGRYQTQFMDVMNRFRGEVLAADKDPATLDGTFDYDKRWSCYLS
jgi:uncharacterized protein (DUF1330 family)